MSLSVNPTNYQPSFGSNKALTKAGTFATNQMGHFAKQALAWGIMETSDPSPDLQRALIRKFSIDIAEVLLNFTMKKPSSEVKIGNQCTNVFAYLADGARALSKIYSRHR